MRAVFTFGYNFKSKQPNPYRSQLTNDAHYLMNALDEKSRKTLQSMGEDQLVEGLNGMGVTNDLEKAVDALRPEEKIRFREIEH